MTATVHAITDDDRPVSMAALARETLAFHQGQGLSLYRIWRLYHDFPPHLPMPTQRHVTEEQTVAMLALKLGAIHR